MLKKLGKGELPPSLLKMKLLLSILLLFSFGASAQRGLVIDAIDQNVLNDDLLQSRYKQISGSPYYFVDFSQGSVEFINDQKNENVPVRVDIYAKTVQLKLDNVVTEFDSKYVKSLSLQDPNSSEVISFKVIEINKSKKLVVSYFDDKIKFFGVPDVEKRISTSSQTSYSSADQRDKFVRSEDYYIYLDGNYTAVKLNKKSILAVLGEDKDLLNFIKANKIKFNRMDDVVKLFKYFNDKI
jgi:hypothetical protein